MTPNLLIILLIALPVAAAPPERSLSFTKLWTHGHTTPGQVAEIPAFDSRTNTIWVAGVVGVDILNRDTGALVEHIDVTPHGFVNSVSIHNGLAAFAIEAGAAHSRGIYDDGRSRDKGVEPEGVALLEIRGRTYAFVGLERTTISSVAVFDVTNPHEAAFLDLIVTPGDLSPEGLAAFAYRGDFYLAISNEVPASGAPTSNTTLYRVNQGRD
jgi:hypothetical protein